MASYRVSLMLIVLACVGCVLSSTATGESGKSNRKIELDREGEALKRVLINDPLTDEQIEEKLKATSPEAYLYIDDTKFIRRKVGELAKICDASLDECLSKKAMHIEFEVKIFEESIPQLFKYGQNCIDKFKNYCDENINQVVENSFKEVSEKDRKLMASFRAYLRERDLLNSYYEFDKDLPSINKKAEIIASGARDAARFERGIAELEGKAKEDALKKVYVDAFFAYLSKSTVEIQKEREKLHEKITESYHECLRNYNGREISIDQEELFLNEFLHATLSFHRIYRLLDDISRERGLARANKSTLELFTLAKIASDFFFTISPYIYLELVKRIPEEWGQQYSMTSFDLADLTKDEVLARQAKRKEAAAASWGASWRRLAGSFQKQKSDSK